MMTEGSPGHDRIILQGMQFYGYHGANPEERALGQSYEVDLWVELDLSVPGASDRWHRVPAPGRGLVYALTWILIVVFVRDDAPFIYFRF